MKGLEVICDHDTWGWRWISIGIKDVERGALVTRPELTLKGIGPSHRYFLNRVQLYRDERELHPPPGFVGG
jgi:hypothetical protein